MLRPKAEFGFSLVEVVLAIGVVAFSFVAIFALLPTGLGQFRQAMDATISADIVQRVVSDAEQTDFNTLIGSSPSGNYFALPLRYFDDQGTEVKIQNSVPSSGELVKIRYWVRVRGSLPGNPDPATHTTAFFTSLPSTGSQRFNPRASTFLTVQIASNPGGIKLDGLINPAFLVDETKARAANLRLQTYSTVIARNGN